MATTQITVRLPDDEVTFIDSLIEAGRAASRAAVVSGAIRREQRRQAAIRDLEILTATAGEPDPDDLDGLAAWGAALPLDID